MKNLLSIFLLLSPFFQSAIAETTQRVVDIPTRPGVSQRFLLLTPENTKAAVILFAGGHGGLEIKDDGTLGWGNGNFLVRSRDLFANQDLVVAVIDKPSDKKNLSGQRETADHVADVGAVIRWLHTETRLPVWLIGTSRGTQSAAFVASALDGKMDGPDGIVLTSTILTDTRETAVLEMPIEKIHVPVLVVHHEKDGCSHCNFSDVPTLMEKLTSTSRKALLSFSGGNSKGDPCEAKAYHGYNGLENSVVEKIAGWMNEQKVAMRSIQ